MIRKTALLLALSALPLFAAAQQTIWRCGSSYSAAPCAEGRSLEGVEARPGADVQSAQEMAAREKRLADGLRQERLQREQAAGRQGAAGIYAPVSLASKADAARGKLKKKAEKAPHRAQQSPEDAGTWRAAAPPTRRTKG